MSQRNAASMIVLAAGLLVAPVHAQPVPGFPADGKFIWRCGPPVQSPAERPEDPCVSVKDPTIVRHNDRWHLFTTIRSEKRTHQIEYSSFADWKDAATAERHLLTIHPGYFCAPQVFYFTPQKKWYLLHQATDPNRTVKLQPAFSTTTTIEDPKSWSAPRFLYDTHPANIKGWIDFWIICDEAHAHLFFTSNNGLMWRAQTKLDQFPKGWSQPQVVLRDDLFEASHTYKLQGLNRYLTLVEAQNSGRRYYKAYLADRLDGAWQPFAASREIPFAGPQNVTFEGLAWTDSFSHGELLRLGSDEHLEVDPDRLRFLFQGVLDRDMQGRPYGKIPWKLGLLEAVPPVR